MPAKRKLIACSTRGGGIGSDGRRGSMALILRLALLRLKHQAGAEKSSGGAQQNEGGERVKNEGVARSLSRRTRSVQDVETP